MARSVYRRTGSRDVSSVANGVIWATIFRPRQANGKWRIMAGPWTPGAHLNSSRHSPVVVDRAAVVGSGSSLGVPGRAGSSLCRRRVS
jgi:hypothetical protein